MLLNISYKVSGEKLLKLILFEHVFIWLVTTSFYEAWTLLLKKSLWCWFEGLKPSLDEQEQILLMRKRNVAWQNNQKKQ